MWHFVHGLLLKPLPSSSVAFHSVSPVFFSPSVSSSLVSFFPVFFHFCWQPFCPFLFSPFLFSPAILVHAEHSAMRQCRPTPPIIVPRGSAHPTPPTWHPAVTKHHPQNHIFTICQGREVVLFFFSLSFLSLLSKDVCGASCSATCFRN